MNLDSANSPQNSLLEKVSPRHRRHSKVRDDKITLAHGSGGKAWKLSR